jgi:hypothetical protein
VDEKSEAIREFLAHHNLDEPEGLDEDLDAVYLLISIKSAINEGLRTRVGQLFEEGEPTWTFTRTMLDRNYELVEAGFIALLTGAWASVEVICRASLEAAVNVLYVLEDDTANRLSQYVSYYFEETSKSLSRAKHLDSSVADVRKMVESRKELVKMVFQDEGIPFGKEGWPRKIVDRFKATGREFEYREIYANLSQQAHNDADALIDYIIVKSLEEQIPGAVETFSRETLLWLRLYLHRSLIFYSDAADLYASRYGLVNTRVSIERASLLLSSRLEYVYREFRRLRSSAQQ